MENKPLFPIRAPGMRASPGCDRDQASGEVQAFRTVIDTGTAHIRSRLARDKQPRSAVPSQVWATLSSHTVWSPTGMGWRGCGTVGDKVPGGKAEWLSGCVP